MSLLCQVFRSSQQQEMYLYVDSARGLQDVPEDLLSRFGEPAPVFTMQLTPARKLARADAAKVLASIAKHGFYLQLPPSASGLDARERVCE